MQSRWIKVFVFAVLGIAALASVAITLTVGWRPFIGPRKRPVTGRRFVATPERLQRGAYLVNAVTGCVECHSQFVPGEATPPVMASRPGAGGQVFVNEPGLRVVSSNITPDRETGVGAWSDDELARAIREGIGRDERTLFPVMPYQKFRAMSDEDLASVIVYLRTLEPARNIPPKTQVAFVPAHMIRSLPEPVTVAVAAPSKQDKVQYGAYILRMGACADCHTPVDEHHMPLASMDLAGGFPFGEVVTANITPDPSGISYYDEALFLQAMRTGQVGGRKIRFPMPWWLYRNMNDDDLKALFAYIRTVKPVQHRVDNTEPPTYCRIWRQKHGLGHRN